MRRFIRWLHRLMIGMMLFSAVAFSQTPVVAYQLHPLIGMTVNLDKNIPYVGPILGAGIFTIANQVDVGAGFDRGGLGVLVQYRPLVLWRLGILAQWNAFPAGIKNEASFVAGLAYNFE